MTCPRCRRTTCHASDMTKFAASKGWPDQLRRFVSAINGECEQVARELANAVREAWAS